MEAQAEQFVTGARPPLPWQRVTAAATIDDASEAWKAPSRTQDRPSGATITALLHLVRSQNSLFSLVASLCFMSSTLFIS